MKTVDLRRRNLKWSGNDLKLGRKVLASIEPDAKYAGMWRVRQDGELSDMVNLTRARDAAEVNVMRKLRQAQDVSVGLTEACAIEKSSRGVG